LTRSFGASVRKACAAPKLSRTVYLYRSVAKDERVLITRMKEITLTRVHYGYRQVHVLLKREGFKDNHKRIYRLYRERGLSVHHKRPKRSKAAQQRLPITVSEYANQVWGIDFVADNPFDSRKLRMLTVLDCFTRKSLAVHAGQSLKGEDAQRKIEAWRPHYPNKFALLHGLKPVQQTKQRAEIPNL
jgi:putative transposase